MTDAYIRYWSIFLLDKLIICQDAGKERFLLRYLKNALTRFLFLPLDLLLVGLDT